MSIEDFIIAVFCLIDDEFEKMLKGTSLRERGRVPKLTDSEIITMEIVGEFLKKDSDKAIWEYFESHWRHFFPNMPDRSNFAKQAANLHIVKKMLQERLAASLGAFNDTLHLIDGLPIPVCKFARANFARIFRGEATYGYCAAKQEYYYGFHGHIAISSKGVITAGTFAAANIDERDVCPELLEKIRGLVLGDKGFMRPRLKRELAERGIFLETPLRNNMSDKRPQSFLRWLTGERRLIETVIGQLSERFHIQKVRARDLWHQASRFWRKLLAHTACIVINELLGNEPLQFDCLITH